MSSLSGSRVIVAIDIGTTKICALIARCSKEGDIELIGMGAHPSLGMQKGVIVNIAQAANSIREAVGAAQEEAGIQVEEAIVGISGSHIQSINSSGVVAIKKRDVSQHDVDRVIEAARTVYIPEDRSILHVIPQYFRVDGQERVLDSLGMYGVRLEAHVHIITGAVSSAQNIIKSCHESGIVVTDIVLEQIASAGAVLTPSEKELGVGILDIGGGTSDFAVYKNGKIMYSKVLPVAGNHFTNDLAVCLKIPLKSASMVKHHYGYVHEQAYDEKLPREIRVATDIQDHYAHVDTDLMYEVLRARAEELCELLRDEIEKGECFNLMQSGLVLTGGGSLMKGMIPLFEEGLACKTRVGIPGFVLEDVVAKNLPEKLKSPLYATAYGLLLFANQQQGAGSYFRHDEGLMNRVVKKMSNWIHEYL